MTWPKDKSQIYEVETIVALVNSKAREHLTLINKRTRSVTEKNQDYGHVLFIKQSA